MITSEQLKQILTYSKDTGLFRWNINIPHVKINVGDIAGSSTSNGYIQISIKRKPYLAHRLAWLHETGEWPKQLDHRDLNRSNNKWDNLRLSTQSKNMANIRAHKDNKLGVKGVYFTKGKYQAGIKVKNKLVYLGRFGHLEEAKAAYSRAAFEHFGKHARLS